jgi:hypothetical protein
MRSYRTLLAFTCIQLLVMVTGCLEAPLLGRKVVTTFATHSGDSVGLALTDSEVQQALAIVDATLASDGFVREQHPNNEGLQGFVAAYSKLDSRGLRQMGDVAQVYFLRSQLEVVFFEGRKPSPELRSHVTRVLNLLKSALGSHYGFDRVKVVSVKT